MSILLDCQKGLIPPELGIIAKRESLSAEYLRSNIVNGTVVVTSAKRNIQSIGIGEGLRKKFGTIVGASTAAVEVSPVICKAKVAQKYGASAIHDGSAAGDIYTIHRRLLEEIQIPVGFCHAMRVAALCEGQDRNFLDVEAEEFIALLEEDAASGCELLLGPFSLTMDLVEMLSTSYRIVPSPNKTGSLMIAWMRHNNSENPYVRYFDRVLAAARENDVILSFVNAFRSGCIADALDEMQFQEIRQMSSLIQQAQAAGVQVKAGGGGHVALDKIPQLFQFEREHVSAPIVSFGPQVTDMSLTFDHVTAAIGQSWALMNGADMILTITAAEHLALPRIEEVRESCIIAHYVCHSVDLANGKDLDQDFELSKARERLDWETQFSFAVDPLHAEAIHRRNDVKPGCSMCGDSCAYLVMRQTNEKAGNVPEVKSAIEKSAEVMKK